MNHLLVAALLSTPLMAFAQKNIGELLDQGGAQLTKPALTELLSGTTWQHPFYPGEVTYKASGTYSGTITDTVNERQVGIFGAWEVNDEGLVCEQSEGRYAYPKPLCRYWFSLGERYFASQQSGDRAAPIGKRVRKR